MCSLDFGEIACNKYPVLLLLLLLYVFMYMYVYIYHTRVLECGLRAFHSLLSNTLERGGGGHDIFLLRVCHLLFGNS